MVNDVSIAKLIPYDATVQQETAVTKHTHNRSITTNHFQTFLNNLVSPIQDLCTPRRDDQLASLLCASSPRLERECWVPRLSHLATDIQISAHSQPLMRRGLLTPAHTRPWHSDLPSRPRSSLPSWCFHGHVRDTCDPRSPEQPR